jgi:hypothetical protein
MTPLEDEIRDALRAEAGRLREVRPLRLEPAPYQLRPSAPRRRARLRRAWLAPVTAAALVIALAIALVIVRTLQNGPAVPAVPQPSAPTIFPRYYVALEQSDYNTGNALRLVVGDSVTGKTLATFNAPAGAAFEGRTPVGSADDRTFIVAETHSKGKPPFPPGTADGPRAWYMLRLSPGSANPVTMTTLPLQPTARNLPVTETVLSADGRYLAVASGDVTTRRADLRVYSVATGHLVHAWTMVSASASSALFPFDLSWVNGDATVAFAISVGSRVQVRTVSVTAPGTGLLTASHVVWSQYEPTVLRSLPRPGTATWCAQPTLMADGQAPTLTADGQAVTCSTWPTYYPGGALTATEWLAYPTSAPTARRVIARIPPAVTKLTKGIQGADTVMVHVSASEVIGYSFVVPAGDTGPVTIHEFIASDGTVRQLGTGTIPPWPALAWFTQVTW